MRIRKIIIEMIERVSFALRLGILLSLLLIFISFLNENEKRASIRSLVSQIEMKSICDNSNSKLQEYLSTYIYPGGLKERNVKKSNELIDLIISGGINLDSLTQYAIRLLPYLVFVFFFVLIIVGWIIACGCRCCSCFCYNKQLTQKHCYPCVSISSILMNISILITSIIGFATLFNWNTGFNSAVCAIMMLPNDIEQGQDIDALKRWRGINGTSQILKHTVELFKDIVSNQARAFSANGWIATDPDDLFATVDAEYLLYANEKLDNPNPNNKAVKITPTYILNYGPPSEENQYLYKIITEFNERILPLIDLIKESTVVVDNIAINIADIDSSFTSAKDSILTFSEVIQTFETSFVDLVLSVKGLIDTFSQLVFIIFFVILIISNLTAVIILPTFIYCLYKPLKCYFGFLWCFYLLISMFFFILGGLMGSIGLVSNDLISVIQYLFSEDNLNSGSPALINGGALGYISACVNGNGELGNVVATPSFGDSTIDDFYKLYFTLLKRKEALKSYSEEIELFKSSLQQSKTNFALTTIKEVHNDDDIDSVLKEFSRYTYAGDYQEICILATKDFWTLEKDHCPRGYLYHPPSYLNSFLADSCLIVSEWTRTTVPNLYQTACNLIGGKYNTASLAATDYIDTLDNYETKNNVLIDKILLSNKNLETQYNAICAKLAVSIKNLEDLLSPFSLYFKEIVEDNQIMSFLNCEVIGQDLKVIYEQFGGQLSYYSESLGLCCIFISFLNIITAVLMMIVQSQEKYYHDNANEKTQTGMDQNGNKRDKNEIQTEIIPIASQKNEVEENRSPNLPRKNTVLNMQNTK